MEEAINIKEKKGPKLVPCKPDKQNWYKNSNCVNVAGMHFLCTRIRRQNITNHIANWQHGSEFDLKLGTHQSENQTDDVAVTAYF